MAYSWFVLCFVFKHPLDFSTSTKSLRSIWMFLCPMHAQHIVKAHFIWKCSKPMCLCLCLCMQYAQLLHIDCYLPRITNRSIRKSNLHFIECKNATKNINVPWKDKKRKKKKSFLDAIRYEKLSKFYLNRINLNSRNNIQIFSPKSYSKNCIWFHGKNIFMGFYSTLSKEIASKSGCNAPSSKQNKNETDKWQP